MSDQCDVLAGVPQGTVLGPLLFLIYINDLNSQLDCFKISYADDLTVVAQLEYASVSVELQKDLCRINRWSYQNGIRINASKSCVMRISHKRKPGAPYYSYGDTELPIVTNTNILGVMFDKKLDWKLQIESVMSKSRRMLGFCFRHTKEAGPDAFRVLYSSLVLSVVENCNLVWYPASI